MPCNFDIVQGSLPADWAQCALSDGSPMPCMSKLANLTCSTCGLSGNLSATWLYVNLRQLSVPNNSITGGLAGPSSAGAPNVPPSQLQALDLSYNSLDSAADAGFWNHTRASLRRLQLQGNKLAHPLSSKRCACCQCQTRWFGQCCLLAHTCCFVMGHVQWLASVELRFQPHCNYFMLAVTCRPASAQWQPHLRGPVQEQLGRVPACCLAQVPLTAGNPEPRQQQHQRHTPR